MNAEEIKLAIDMGLHVYCCHEGYRVKKDSAGRYIICHAGSVVGLTGQPGTEFENVLNGNPDRFYIDGAEDEQHDKLADMFLDWFNNFITTEAFAAHYGLPRCLVEPILQLGNLYHEMRASK